MCGMLIAFAFVFVFVGGAGDEKAGSWVDGPQHHATPRHATHAIRLKQRRFRQLYTQAGSRTEGSGNRDRKR